MIELFKREQEIKMEIKKLEEELENINVTLNAPIEICEECSYFYIGHSELFLMFTPWASETTSLDDPFFRCHCCEKKLRRHDSFMKALEYMTTDDCGNYIFQNFRSELGDDALIYLAMTTRNISVPSFTVVYDIKHKDDNRFNNILQELQENDFIRIIEATNIDHFTVVFNARKIGLYENNDILSTICIQKKFDKPYLFNVNKRTHRLNNLENNFSLEDKERLLKRFNNKCAFTGKDVDIHLDHVIPVAWEVEGTTISNMLPLWSRLNSSKHDSNVFEWYKNKGAEYEVREELFIDAITYIAELKGMTFEEYKDYVYSCDPKSK